MFFNVFLPLLVIGLMLTDADLERQRCVNNMGCGRSSSKPTGFKAIDLAIEPCPLYEFERITRPTTEHMRTLEECYNRFYKCLENLESASGADIISKHSFHDTMLAVCLCFSVSSAGEVNRLDLTAKAEPPYLSLVKLRLHQDHMPAADYWDEIVKYLGTFPEVLRNVEEELAGPVRLSKGKA